MSTINAGAFRGTRYFTRRVEVGPNSFVVDVVEHGVLGSKPATLELHEADFTDEEMLVVHAALTLLERKYEEDHQRKEDELGIDGRLARNRAHEFVKAMQDAKSAKAEAELRHLEVTTKTIHAQEAHEKIVDQVRDARAILERVEAEGLRKRAELDDLDAQIEAKKAVAK